MEIQEIISEWSSEDLQNLIRILDPNNEVQNFQGSEVEKVIHLFRWAYYSNTRAVLKNEAMNLWRWFNEERKSPINAEKEYPLPSYENLLESACKKTNSFAEGSTTHQLEIYLIETVMIKALFSMKAEDRHRTLNETFSPEEVARNANIKSNYIAPITVLGTLALANASGFGIYLAATTTLGFLTHAIGIALPFAAYTGLTSSIAFLIGPVGWLGAGVWAFWTLTGAEWKKIIPAVMYIISVKYRKPNNLIQ